MEILKKEKYKPTILYVEDDATTRKLVELVIAGKFPDVTLVEAENGEAGLAIFREHDPDLVITDVNMPVMDGIQMATELRKLNKKTPVIITTAVSDVNRILQAIDIGINHYVLKPIDNDKLITAIESCIGEISRELKLREQGEFIRKLTRAVEQSPVAIMITDTAGTIEYVNPGFARLTGYSFTEAVGSNARLLKSGEIKSAAYKVLWETITAGNEWWGELHNRRNNGELYWSSASISPVTDGAGTITHFIAFQEDITERKRAEETIRQLAHFDTLTGLPNRYFFQELLHNALAQAQRHSRLLAVLFLDLDHFKQINDNLGHAAGDHLLQAAAHRLKECCRRAEETVARQGGDEFIILLPELDDIQEPVRIAQRVIEAFSHPLVIPGHELSISTSIGISIFPNDGCDSETLIKKADMAMYRAKEGGRNRYDLSPPAMDNPKPGAELSRHGE